MESTEIYSEDQQNGSNPSPDAEARPAAKETKRRKNFFLNDFFNRLNASIIDILLFLGGLTVILVVVAQLKGTRAVMGQQVRTETAALLALRWVAVVLWFFFSVIMRDAWGYSRSVGKRFCNLKVFAVRAPKPRFYHSLLRNLTVLLPVAAVLCTYALKPPLQETLPALIVRWASLALLLLEGVLALTGFRRIGDLIAGTKVIFFKDNGQRNNHYNNRQQDNGGYNGGAQRYRGGGNNFYRGPNRRY